LIEEIEFLCNGVKLVGLGNQAVDVVPHQAKIYFPGLDSDFKKMKIPVKQQNSQAGVRPTAQFVQNC
jgi:hypothetical protein